MIDVSVITPTFRREKQLVESVKSALSQSGVRLEVIVLDDSGEATARSAVEAIGDERVRYVSREVPSKGKPALVRNEGAKLARGRYLQFLDDDDRLAEGASAALMHALETSDAGVSFGAVEPFGDDEAVLAQQRAYFLRARARAASMRRRSQMVASLLFRETVLVSSACMLRASCFASLGGFDPEVLVCEDVDFYLRAIRAFGVRFVDRSVLHYRTGAPSLMHDLRAEDRKVHTSYARIYERYRREHGALELFALKVLAKIR